MISATTHTQLNKRICLSLVTMLLACSLYAQNHEHYDSLAARYRNENAVYADITYKLIIAKGEGDTGLVANSHVTMEKLFITDLSLNTENVDMCDYSDLNPLTDIKAVASMPAGRGYKKVECNNFGSGRPSDFVFYDDYRIVEAIYSGLAKNSVTTTRYSLEHTDIHMLPTFLLQKNIPIAHATFEVVAPDYVDISFLLKGENTAWFKQSKEEKNGNTIYRFTAIDVPAYKGYSNVPSFRYIMPHIIPYITAYKLPDVDKTVEMLDNSDGLHKYDYKYVRSLNMRVDPAIKQLVKELTKNDATQSEKAAHIYQWVQKNIHYIAFEKGLEGFVPREADTVFKRKYGDCKDMASIIVAMCHTAGLNAYFASIGTWDLPYTHKEMPTEDLYNHVICALKLDDKWIFMDGTHPNLPFGANRYDIQGKEAMISIDEKNYEIVTIPVEAADKNVTFDSTFISLGDNKISGSAVIHYQGYPAWGWGMYLQNYHKKDERDKAIRHITARGTNKYLVSKYDISANDPGNKDLFVSADFTIGDYVQKVGKNCYVNMNLNHPFEEDRINDPDRKVGFYHNYKNRTTEVVTMEVPAGYRLTYVPKDAQGDAGGMWNYKISYTIDAKRISDAKTITLRKEYRLNTMSISSDHFAENNKTVDALRKACKESVVLTKK